MNANTNMYLTAYGNSNGTSNGKTATSAGNVFIKTYNVNDHQQWQLIEVDEPPIYADPFGKLEVVNSSMIKGWAWCEDLPNTAMNIQIRIQNSAGTVVDTLTTTANIYRSDLSNEECGNGNYGFQCNVNWSDYGEGVYTVRAFAGINTPNIELNDSMMLYNYIASAPNAEALTLNAAKTKTIQAGEEHIYYFTPMVTGTYVVQTTGDTDTYGMVTVKVNNEDVVLANDNDGIDSNFSIMFYATANQPVIVKVTKVFSSIIDLSNSYTIKVHRARAQIYTFSYDGFDTTSDAIIPYSGFTQLGYQAYSHENEESTHALQSDNSGMSRFNSEIILFSGHGNLEEDDNYLLFLNSILSPEQLPQMNNVHLAIWSACYSAAQIQYNIAKTAYYNGATTSIGWYDSISNSYSNTWINIFFTYVCNGYAIEDAIYYANYAMPIINIEPSMTEEEIQRYTSINNIVNTLEVYGDIDKCLEPTTFTGTINLPSTNSNINSLDISNVLERLNNYDYVICDIGKEGKRYIKTINGIQTNEYYDVYNNGTIVSSDIVINQNEIAKVIENQKDTSYTSTKQTKQKFDFEAYYKINGKLTHIGVFESNGTVCCENLNNGEAVDTREVFR